METLYFWRHTDRRTGRRVKTRHRLSEADAVRTLIDAERIEWGALTVQPEPITPAGHWRSGLVPSEPERGG